MKAIRKVLFAALVSFTVVFVQPAYAQLAAPNDSGITFSHMHLVVPDTELNKKLWIDLFDAVPVKMEGFTAVKLSGALIFLGQGDSTLPSSKTVVDHFGLNVSGIDSILSQWQNLEYQVDRKFKDDHGLTRAFITMPGGVKLELQDDPDLSVKAEMDHVHIISPLYTELPAWYADLFGAVPQSGGKSKMIVEVPGARLIFEDAEVERAPSEDSAIDHFGFEVEDMDAFTKMLKAKDIKLVFGPKYIKSLELWVAFFK